MPSCSCLPACRTDEIADDAFTTEAVEEFLTIFGEPGSLRTAWRVQDNLREMAYTQVGGAGGGGQGPCLGGQVVVGLRNQAATACMLLPACLPACLFLSCPPPPYVPPGTCLPATACY